MEQTASKSAAASEYRKSALTLFRLQTPARNPQPLHTKALHPNTPPGRDFLLNF